MRPFLTLDERGKNMMNKTLRKFLFISIFIGMAIAFIGFFSTIQFGIFGVIGSLSLGVIILIIWALYVKREVKKVQS